MTDKVAVITGGGTGIGKAVAVRLAEKGWKLALLGRRLDKLEAAAAAVGGDPLIIPCDVADSGAVQAAFTRIAGHFGRVDMLFNNAGMGAMPAEVDEHDIAAWDRVVSVNLSGAFYCAREAFGISAHTPRPRSIAYTATKHAMTGLTKSLFLDGRPHDIVAGQIDIGNTLTDMAVVMTQGMPQANGTIAAEPTFDVGHVADAVALMAELPLDANVPFMTIMASKMPYVGRG